MRLLLSLRSALAMVLLSSALTVPALDIKTLGGREFKNAKVLHQTR